jgi:hypothetical protein
MYTNPEYLKKAVGAIIGAIIAVPSIASGYYFIYLTVTAIGN